MRLALLLILTFLAGCAHDQVLSENNLSISIEHNNSGRAKAFGMAEEHCRSLNKTAVHTGSDRGFGPYQTSTWECR